MKDIASVFAGEPAGAIVGASADGQAITSDVVPIARIAIGEAVFHDVGAVVGVIEPGNPFHCITDSGFIGASLMQAATWRIDPTTQTVTIAASADELDTDDALRLDFRPSSEVSPSPLFELPAGEGALTFLADTGSDGWLAVNPVDLDGLGLQVPDDVPVMSILGTSAVGSFSTRAHWLTVELGVGDELRPTPVAATEVAPEGQGIAGTDFLRHFIVTIDWAESVLYLEPLDGAEPSTPSSAGLGWNDGYVIGSFVEGHPGNEDLLLGATVSAIDGQSVAGVPFDDYCTRVASRERPCRVRDDRRR